MPSPQKQSLRLSALLHDIGKFKQGTGEKGPHNEIGRKFIHQYIPEKWRNTGTVSAHHKPEMYLGKERKPLKTLTLADWLSSSERTSQQETHQRTTTPLNSILTAITLDKQKPATKHYKINPLQLTKNIFPTTTTQNLQKNYQTQWQQFTKEIQQIPVTDNHQAYFETLYNLLEKYTWCIPSAVWKHQPDISLFNHLKSTTAIHTCLEDTTTTYLDNCIKTIIKKQKIHEKHPENQQLENNLDPKTLKHYKQEKILLIGGDLSGVQDFIYSITSKGAAKSLRGRSYYLQLLIQTITNHIITRLDLTPANIIFNGGGHFYILAPKNKEKTIKKLQTEITKKLYEQHNGELYLAIAYTGLSAHDIESKQFTKKSNIVAKKLAHEKKKKWHQILKPENHQQIFLPTETQYEICSACQTMTDDLVTDPEDPLLKKCRFCDSVEKLAKEIAETETIYITQLKKEAIENIEPGWRRNLAQFNTGIYFKKQDIEKIIDQVEYIRVKKINSTDFLPPDPIFNKPTSYGFTFNLNTGLKEFEELADNAEGDPKWAVLRMDVDNLGKIVSEGLGETRSISRISTLSYFLSLYFNGWINKITQEHPDECYGIYSGGDDLFLVTSWSTAPVIAEKIQSSFHTYTGENPNITISAGISIAPNKKYPIHKVADMAKTVLDDHAKQNPGKNSINFLNNTIKWSKYKTKLLPLKNELHYFHKDNQEHNPILHRGFLQKLNTLHETYQKQAKQHGSLKAKHDDRYGKWRWHMVYLFSRTKVPQKHRQRYEKIQKNVKDNIDILPIATRWVELLTRRN